MNSGDWVPLSKNPWDRIIPNLWQGGMYYGPSMTLCVPADQFDVVVNMAGQGDHSYERITNDHPIIYNNYIDDDRLGPGEMAIVMDMVDVVLNCLDEDRKTLVRCRAGWNRSGLVVGLVLRSLGWPAQAAIDLIREKRDPSALCNEHFVKYIYDHPGR